MAREMLRLCRERAPLLFAASGPGCVRGKCPEGKLTCEGKTYESKQMAMGVAAVEELVLRDLLAQVVKDWCGGK